MNGFLDRMKSLLRGGQPEPSTYAEPEPPPHMTPEEHVEAVLDVIEGRRSQTRHWPGEHIKLSDLRTWQALSSRDGAEQASAAMVAVLRGNRLFGGAATTWAREQARLNIASQLVRRALPFSQQQLTELMTDVCNRRYPHTEVPLASILGAVERFCDGKAPAGELREALLTFRDRIERENAAAHQPSREMTKTLARVVAILVPQSGSNRISLPHGDWGYVAAGWAREQPRASEWMALLRHAATSGDKSKPGQKWLTGAKPCIDAVGAEAFAAQLVRWLESLTPDPQYPDASLDVLKGLIWCAALLDATTIATPIGRFAEVCFRKVPNIGARSVRLGNACMVTLSSLAPAEEAIAELVRLKARIKYGSAKGLIERQLSGIAEQQGVATTDLEEGALPTWDVSPEGRFEQKVGEATAVIALTETGAELQWIDAKGRARAAPPASVKTDHAAEIKVLKKRVKDIDAAVVGQVTLLENTWLGDRSWPLPLWRRRFLDHPIRSPLVRALIWRLESDGKAMSAMPGPDGWSDTNGKPVSPSETSIIRLWHPLDSKPDDVLDWRRRIVDLGITQPIKQAHREIYVLTDAELSTETYSNRFAAHIIRQHQFRALCQARGWNYQFQGGWDSFNTPSRTVPSRNIKVEYHVDVAANDEQSQSGVALHLATDQVRFSDANNRQLKLVDVPPIVFSELMRDVDLFVAVCSVANDPDWVDGGPDGRHGAYWQRHAFGDLSVTATTRRDLLEQLTPKLAIADRLKVAGNFLEVRGNRQSYRIHLGSSNIQILPSNRYLCIVRGATKGSEGGSIRLPFAGDSTLAIILSKAFMLAEDDKITDPSIVRQL